MGESGLGPFLHGGNGAHPFREYMQTPLFFNTGAPWRKNMGVRTTAERTIYQEKGYVPNLRTRPEQKTQESIAIE